MVVHFVLKIPEDLLEAIEEKIKEDDGDPDNWDDVTCELEKALARGLCGCNEIGARMTFQKIFMDLATDATLEIIESEEARIHAEHENGDHDHSGEPQDEGEEEEKHD